MKEARIHTPVARRRPAGLIAVLVLVVSFAALCPESARSASPKRRSPIVDRAIVPPFAMHLTQNDVEIANLDETGQILSSGAVGIKVGNALLGWRIVCQAGDAQGPDGARIAASDIRILARRRLDGYGLAPTPADKPVVVVQGSAIGGPSMREVGAFAVQAQIGLDTPPGVYKGVLRVYADAPNSRSFPEGISSGADRGGMPVQEVPLTFCVPESFRIYVSEEAMNFGSVQPGLSGSTFFTSLNTPRVMIETNQRRLQAQVVMDALRLVGSDTLWIAGKRTAIAWGRTPAEALLRARTAPIGQNQFVYPLDKAGRYTFYLAGRVSILMSDEPGNYQGRATITANVQ